MPSESSQFINPCIVQGDIWEEITQEIKEQVLDKIENTKIIYQKTKTPTNNIKILKLMFNQKVSKKKKKSYCYMTGPHASLAQRHGHQKNIMG